MSYNTRVSVIHTTTPTTLLVATGNVLILQWVAPVT